MSDISFGLLSVLLVEDNHYLRNLLFQILKDLGFGQIYTANNGQEAIEFLTPPLGISKDSAFLKQVDIIISDLVMSPIDGELFLRWIRTSKKSPNRFIPFVMVSGAADADRVEGCRDYGVTEFLAKPFSARSVYERIMKVIVSPRQIVCAQNYFGPDRRRSKYGPPNGVERRQNEEAKATIVYSADKIVKPKTPSDIWIFRLPNTLKEKIGGANIHGPISIPEELLAQAEESLERQALDFTEWATKYLNDIGAMLTKAIEIPEKRRNCINEINILAHELRGQGGTFGYPLITIFGKSLYDATHSEASEDETVLDIIKAHIDAMKAVLREKIAGDGGPIGRQLLEGLKAAIAKISGKADLAKQEKRQAAELAQQEAKKKMQERDGEQDDGDGSKSKGVLDNNKNDDKEKKSD
ncbi:MAG: response regulator, partial [Alphaproteobacteria bacterium]